MAKMADCCNCTKPHHEHLIPAGGAPGLDCPRIQGCSFPPPGCKYRAWGRPGLGCFGAPVLAVGSIPDPTDYGDSGVTHPAPTGSAFPHKCPRCKGPAYIGFTVVECKAKCA